MKKVQRELTERLERRQIQRCTFIFILYTFAGAFLFLEEIMEKELMKKRRQISIWELKEVDNNP